MISEDMMALLADGKPHTTDELHRLCGPSLRAVVRQHIGRLRRKKLRPLGLDVLRVWHNHNCCWQLVRTLGSPDDGS